MITILNTSIITTYGSFHYRPVNLETAKDLIGGQGFKSAVGHQSTCDALTKLLGVNVPLNRIQYAQEAGETALVFKLKGRLEEGRVLNSIEEIEQIGYEFGVLYKSADLERS